MREKGEKTRDLVTQSSSLSPHHSEVNSVLSFSIADITFDVSTDAPDMKLRIDGVMKDFLISEGESDVRVRVAWDDLSKKTFGKKLFDSDSLWQMFQEDGFFCFRFASPIFGLVPYKAAYFDQDFFSGAVYLHRPYFKTAQALYPLEFPLDELLMTNFLARGRGVEIHACGIIDLAGNGLLFPGQSEAGKTTIAKLFEKHEGVTVLSDDRIILRNLDGKIWVYGTPWHGDARLASPARAPLKGIYFLNHGEKNELVPIKNVQALSRLFACSFPQFYSREGLDFILEFLDEVTNAIPCYELKFLPDERIVKFIEGLSDED